ncbi:MAG: SCO family protein [Phycisphaerales bacterium]
MSSLDRTNLNTRPLIRMLGVLIATMSLGLVAAPASAQLLLERDQVNELKGVELEEHLGAQIPLDATFTDADGQTIQLRDYFSDGKPAVLALVYYECPIVCNLVLDTLDESLNQLDYVIGEDYRLIVLSFDHGETTTHALNRRSRTLNHYTVATGDEVRAGAIFLTGDETNIRRVTDTVGWGFAPLPNGEWSHPVGLTILSPTATVSRYIYGFEYPADTLKLSLLEATEGKIAKSIGERIMHFCFRYDPTAGAYSVEAMQLMRLGGALTVVFLIVLISGMLVRERSRNRRLAQAGGPGWSDSSINETVSGTSPDRSGRYAANTAGQVS